MKRKTLNNCLVLSLKNNTPEKHPQWDCYHHFSFLITKGKILEWGTNRASSALTQLGYAGHTKMHSEVDCYFKAKGILDKDSSFEIVNIRLTRTNRIANSTPCRCCSAFLKSVGCKRIWFTTSIDNFACITF